MEIECTQWETVVKLRFAVKMNITICLEYCSAWILS